MMARVTFSDEATAVFTIKRFMDWNVHSCELVCLSSYLEIPLVKSILLTSRDMSDRPSSD